MPRPPATQSASVSGSAAQSPLVSHRAATALAECTGPFPLPYPSAALFRRLPQRHIRVQPDSSLRPRDTVPVPLLLHTTQNPPSDTSTLCFRPSPKTPLPTNPAPTSTLSNFPIPPDRPNPVRLFESLPFRPSSARVPSRPPHSPQTNCVRANETHFPSGEIFASAIAALPERSVFAASVF